MMVILPSNVCSYTVRGRCSGQVQRIALYTEYGHGYVMVKGRRVVGINHEHYLNQITLKPGYVTWYDPKAKKFICWNRKYTKLVATEIPRRLKRCMVEEVTSPLAGYVMYNSTKPGVQMDFPKRSSKSAVMKRRMRHRNNAKSSKNFLPRYDQSSKVCATSKRAFCEQMETVYREGVPPEILCVCCDDENVNCKFLTTHKCGA